MVSFLYKSSSLFNFLENFDIMWPFLGSHPTSLSKVETLPSSQLEKVSSWFMSYSQWACKKLHSAFAFSCTFPLWAGRIGFSPSPFYAKNKKSNTMRQHRRRQYMAGTPGLPNLWIFWSAHSDFTMRHVYTIATSSWWFELVVYSLRHIFKVCHVSWRLLDPPCTTNQQLAFFSRP